MHVPPEMPWGRGTSDAQGQRDMLACCFFFLEKQELRSCLPWRGERLHRPSPNLRS